ncbi:MAG: hypothetical protein NC112_04455 [Oxalobacter formigenes]|nr:hypothetical protein [Oxalobacter formigenes]
MNRWLCFGLYAVIVCFFSACNGRGKFPCDFDTSSDIGTCQTIGKYEESVYCFEGTDGMPENETVAVMKGRAESGYSLAMPNPFVSCDSMEEAARLAGFDMVLPKMPDRLEVLKGVMIQAFYEENGKDMLIRKARGERDISGDYNHYAQAETVDGITIKGENNTFFLAVWAQGGYVYSISVSRALSQAGLLALVAVVR